MTQQGSYNANTGVLPGLSSGRQTGGAGQDLGSGILLKAKKFDLAINFYYSSHSADNEEYGVAHSASVKGYVLSSTTTTVINVVRGDFSAYSYNQIGASGGITTYMAFSGFGTRNTMSYDGSQF